MSVNDHDPTPEPPPMQVALHTPETIYTPRHIPSWLLLSGAAGFVNGFAFVACEQFVTHVTGTVTRAGLESLQFGIAAKYLIIFISFVVGAAAAVVLVRTRARANAPDRWFTPLFAVALILLAVAIIGSNGGFLPIGSKVASDHPPVLLLSLLAFAAGLQNASVASTTGMSVRTTHLSGPTTDVGMLLAAALIASGIERRAALRGAALRGGMVLTFLLGAALSLLSAGPLGYLTLLVPAVAVLVAGMLSFLPEWSPSDFSFDQGTTQTPPEGTLAGLPSDGRPNDEDRKQENEEIRSALHDS